MHDHLGNLFVEKKPQNIGRLSDHKWSISALINWHEMYMNLAMGYMFLAKF